MGRLHEIDRQIESLQAEKRDIESSDRQAKGRSLIQLTGMTLDDVELSSGNGKPWFGTTVEFGKWLLANSRKRFAEWNGRIYIAAELIRGTMIDTSVDVDDLGSQPRP